MSGIEVDHCGSHDQEYDKDSFIVVEETIRRIIIIRIIIMANTTLCIYAGINKVKIILPRFPPIHNTLFTPF